MLTFTEVTCTPLCLSQPAGKMLIFSSFGIRKQEESEQLSAANSSSTDMQIHLMETWLRELSIHRKYFS